MKVEEAKNESRRQRKRQKHKEKLDGKQIKSEEKDRRQQERKQKTDKKDRKRKQRICKERQRRKVESRRQGKWNTGKEILKRVGSEKTKMKKFMLHLENKQRQRKERSKRWK